MSDWFLAPVTRSDAMVMALGGFFMLLAVLGITMIIMAFRR